MGLTTLILGLIIFFAPHVFVTRREARARLIARIGEGPYKIAFSVISAIGIVLIAYGFARYRATEWVNLWYPPIWTRHLALLLNWVAIVCVTAAYIPGNIKRVLKHPMLGRRKAMGLRAFDLERRSRLGDPVWFFPRMGGV